MIKLFIYIFFTSIVINSCTIAQSVEAKRKVIINKALIALENQDTSTLFLLVDTAYYFDIYGKDGFLFKVNGINKHLKKCDLDSAMSQMSKKTGRLNTTEYRLTFCNSKDEFNTDTFYLSFIFSDYENPVKIQLIDVIEKKREIKQTVPVIKQKN